MSTARFTSLLPLFALAVPVANVRAAPNAAPSLTNRPDSVTVYVHRLDVLRQRHDSVRGEFRLLPDGDAVAVDLSAPQQPPAVVLKKKPGAAYRALRAKILAGGRTLHDAKLPLGPAISAKSAVPLQERTAAIELGRHLDQAPRIRLPDLAELEPAPLGEAQRQVDPDKIVSRVVCDLNYPLISAQNNAPISRQTARPGEPSQRSVYVPLKSQIYDKKTGHATKVVHYLAEAELKPEWLQGQEDLVVSLKPEELKIHTSDKLITQGANGVAILGQGASGLGQVTGAMVVDDDGNIYFSRVPPLVVRWNMAKGEYEYPPVNIVDHFKDRLPEPADLPDNLKVNGAASITWQSYPMLAVGDGRLFFTPIINAAYVREDRSSVVFSGIFSMPLAHWDDPDKFRDELRLHVGSGPGFEHSLYDTWPDPADRGRKVGRIFCRDGVLYATSYPGAHGGPWRLELTGNGGVKSFEVVDKAAVDRARRSSGSGRLRTNASGMVGWWNYGKLTVTRQKLNKLFTGKEDPSFTGTVTVYYDAIAAMRLNPTRYAEILDSVAGPSLAPCYMAVHAPGRPGHVLGVGEYGYYLADLDLSTAEEGQVKKTYLRLDLGDSPLTLPLRIGLGPYARVWKRHADQWWLYMGGYTGITRLLYSVGGKPLPSFTMDMLIPGRMQPKALDNAPEGHIKRFRYLTLGLDDRVFLTGTHTAARAGTAYSGGLMSLKTSGALDELEKLSWLSRVYSTIHLRSRTVHQPDGAPVQQLSLAGGRADKGYIFKMRKENVPANTDPKIFLYECPQGGQPRDLFGFGLPLLDGKAEYQDQAFSRDRRFLVILQNNRLLTFDVDAQVFADGRRLSSAEGQVAVWRFSKPSHRLIRTPDDRLLICTSVEGSNTATFHEIDASPEGRLSVKPFLTLRAATPNAVREVDGAVLAFVPDLTKGDGSYDLFLGRYWRHPGTTVRVIRDFLPARQ